jgi:hypothetical protein
MALGRPCAIHDDDIDVEVRSTFSLQGTRIGNLCLQPSDLKPFAGVDDKNITPDAIQPQDVLQPSPMAIPLHILALRRISSAISSKVYSVVYAKGKSVHEREEIIRTLHTELIDWRRNMPFPLPDTHPQVPHMSASWFDFNFYTHLALLYRPSPLFPTLDEHRVKTLAEAAAMSIRQAINMHRQQRFAYNWLNFLAVFTTALSLVYAITASPDRLVLVLKQTKAVSDLESVVELLELMSIKFSVAMKIAQMVRQIVIRYREICDGE